MRKHEFALHIATLSALVEEVFPGEEIVISDEKVVHRMLTVLRLQTDDECIVFDHKLHVRFVIKEFIRKKQIRCVMQSQGMNTILSPRITFLLPVLKRDDFEAALYSLTEVGVTTIQLLLTQKTHYSTFTQKDLERAQRVIIAAAEQSKNFSYPELKAPIFLSQLAGISQGVAKIFFDQKGSSLFSVVQDLHIDCPKDIVLLIGPEGDLSDEEKEIVASKKFIVCALTPTVLRSTQAAALSAGLIRSLLV